MPKSSTQTIVDLNHGEIITDSRGVEFCIIPKGNYYIGPKNEIEELLATGNVTITKGEGIKARSEKAVYDKKTETLTLTNNPELTQDGSALLADKIVIYLQVFFYMEYLDYLCIKIQYILFHLLNYL